MNRWTPLIGLWLLFAGLVTAQAQITVRVGEHRVVQGTIDSLTFPVTITGGDEFQDLVGLLEIEGGLEIDSIVTTGTVWQTAANGFSVFYGSQAPPAAIVDPQISVELESDRLLADGVLFYVTVDISTVPPGQYRLRMVGTSGGDSALFLDGEELPSVTFVEGFIRIQSDQQIWVEQQFPFDFQNPFAEETVWGPEADPDEDGILNCEEYAFGTNPNFANDLRASATIPGQPWAEIRDFNGQPHLFLYYSSRPTAPFTYDLQVVSTLFDLWSTRNNRFVEVAPPTKIGTTGYMFHQLRYNRDLVNQEFFRVQVTK